MQYPQTRYKDSLSVGISGSALSMTAASVPPTRTQGILTIGKDQSNTEDVYYTNVAGNVITISLRGLSQTALTLTNIAGNQKVHNANESLEMTTHHNYDTDKPRIDENDTITGVWLFQNKFKTAGLLDASGNESIDTPATGSAVNQLSVQNAATANNVIVTTAGDDTNINLELQAKGSGIVILENGAQTKTNAAPVAQADIANKKYVDDVAAAGPNASTTVAGKVEQATQAELDNGTAAGGTTAPLFASPDILQVTNQKGAFNFGTTGGGTTAYTLTLTPALTAYVAGQRFFIKMNATNTGASTLNVNGLGAKTIKKFTGTDVASGDLLINSIVELVYDGTNLLILSTTSPYQFLTTKGDLIVATAAGIIDRFHGTDGQTLVFDSSQTLGIKSAIPPLSSANSSSKISSRNGNTASGTQTIAHGLATTPVEVTVFARYGDSGANPNLCESQGFWNGTANSIFSTSKTSAGAFVAGGGQTPNELIHILSGDGGTQSATVSSIDGTNIVLSWTLVGTVHNDSIDFLLIFKG